MSTDEKTMEEIRALKVGERWGAYWKHADGWLRLYPPTDPDSLTDGAGI